MDAGEAPAYPVGATPPMDAGEAPALPVGLLIEIRFEGFELISAEYAASPPGAQEARSIARELDKGGGHAEHAYIEAAVLPRRVDANQQGVEPKQGPSPGPAEASEEQGGTAHGEGGGQEVDELQRTWVALGEVDAGDARIVDLLEELSQVGAPFVPHPRFGEEAHTRAALEEARGEVDVFAKAHGREAFEGFVGSAAHAHVERAGIELVHLALAAANAARGEEGRHGVVDGLLHGSEGGVSAVGTAESIAGGSGQFLLYFLEIRGRDDDVAIKDEYVVALGARHTIVARLSRAAILFAEIAHVELIGISLHDLAARHGRTVLDDDDLKVAHRLLTQTFEELVHFVGTIIDGNDEGVFH